MRFRTTFLIPALFLLGLSASASDLQPFPGPQAGEPDTWTSNSGDSLSLSPFKPTYLERKKWFLNFSAGGGGGLLSSIARMVLGSPAKLDEAWLKDRLVWVRKREDTVDFEMNRLMRGLYLQRRYPKTPLFSPAMLKDVEDTFFGFKYWIDQPGDDTMITWTENHMILFHSLEYLTGQMYPDKVFTNSGKTGQWHMEHARPFILRWIDLHARFGFNEWDSNVYYNEDMPALLNLVDFARDKEIQMRATMAVDLMFLDMAQDAFYGGYPTSHGRTYPDHNKWIHSQSMGGPMKLAFGQGIFTGRDHFSGSFMATGNYVPPLVLQDIGSDMKTPIVSREGQGVGLKQAFKELKWNVDDVNDMVLFWGIGAYAQPETLLYTLKAADKYNLWRHPFFEDAKKFASQLPRDSRLTAIAKSMKTEPMRTLLGNVNKVTWRTEDCMLSSAQSYRSGEPANQHMIWEATLKPDVPVFVNNPGALDDHERAPAYWANDNRLPRVAQTGPVLISLYQLPARKMPGERALYAFTHAWFPKAMFDEVVDKGPWTFGKKGNCFIGLYASQPKQWTTEGREKDREIVASGDRVAWVVHMGRTSTDGSFQSFQDKVSQAALTVSEGHDKVSYNAPGVGQISFGWQDAFLVNGQEIPVDGFDHFNSPYVKKKRGDLVIQVRKGNHALTLDFAKGTRLQN